MFEQSVLAEDVSPERCSKTSTDQLTAGSVLLENCCINNVTILTPSLVVSTPTEGFLSNVTMFLVFADEATRLVKCFRAFSGLVGLRAEGAFLCYHYNVLSCFEKKANYLL